MSKPFKKAIFSPVEASHHCLHRCALYYWTQRKDVDLIRFATGNDFKEVNLTLNLTISILDSEIINN